MAHDSLIWNVFCLDAGNFVPHDIVSSIRHEITNSHNDGIDVPSALNINHSERYHHHHFFVCSKISRIPFTSLHFSQPMKISYSNYVYKLKKPIIPLSDIINVSHKNQIQINNKQTKKKCVTISANKNPLTQTLSISHVYIPISMKQNFH